ncbi:MULTISPECIES: hypothetical protein [Vibrio]|uniref:hypothetical protein n=1 Tax=Vibrio TaxID=662 RepID=UPI0022CD9DAE|nr:hypothetical protein [Vibrio sp. MM46]MDA0125997.1 hypothetical protein [Vibrio sp. MM46]
MTKENYKLIVRASKIEDIGAPYIWGVGFDYPHKEIIRIKNPVSGRKVWVEFMFGDENFRKSYNERKTRTINSNEQTLIISQWYREIIEVNKNESIELEVKKSRLPLWIKTMLAARKHPDSTVRLATYLAVLSVVLGVIGCAPIIGDIIRAIVSLPDWLVALWNCLNK